jgi:hypothetical protein
MPARHAWSLGRIALHSSVARTVSQGAKVKPRGHGFVSENLMFDESDSEPTAASGSTLPLLPPGNPLPVKRASLLLTARVEQHIHRVWRAGPSAL